jgi:hypothetical protein
LVITQNCIKMHGRQSIKSLLFLCPVLRGLCTSSVRYDTSFRYLAHLSKLTLTQSRPVTEWLMGFLSKSVNRRRTSARFSFVRDDSRPDEFLSCKLPASRMHAARHMQFVYENTPLKEYTHKWPLTHRLRLWRDATFGGKNIRSAREELVLPFHAFRLDCHTKPTSQGHEYGTMHKSVCQYSCKLRHTYIWVF